MPDLFGSDTEDKRQQPLVEDRISVNRQYASAFEERKRHEELGRLRDRYGFGENMAEDSYDESSSGSDEDEIGEELTPAVDVQILKTIAAIRRKDERIYEPKADFFSEKELGRIQVSGLAPASASGKKTGKAYTVKDYHRETLLRGEIPGALELSGHTTRDMTHAQEQDQLLRDLKESAQRAFEGDTDEEDSLLQLREKTAEEKEQEEVSYRQWLVNQLKAESTCKEAFKEWIDYHEKPSANAMDDNDKFLMDYVLNRGWVSKDDELPSYKQIVQDNGDVDEPPESVLATMTEPGGIELEEDLEAVDEADRFEKSYNFRFEELDELAKEKNEEVYRVQTFAREVHDSVRAKDTRRALQRQKKKERTQEERKKKEEELKRLKNLKKEEIRDRLKKVQQFSGISQEEVLENLAAGLDPDQEFDPKNWDKLMSKVFDAQYYETQDDAVKPVFSDDEDMPLATEEPKQSYSSKMTAAAKLKSKTKQINYASYSFEDDGQTDNLEDDFCMDADFLPGGECYEEEKVEVAAEQDVATKTKSKKDKDRNKRGKSTEDAPLDKDLLDELYNLDYEDVIGDLPTRFKYRKVDADSFGLKPTDIILADDKQLNQYLSLKKLAPFRKSDQDAEWMKKWRNGKKKRRAALRSALAHQYPDLAPELAKKSKKRTQLKQQLRDDTIDLKQSMSGCKADADRLAIYQKSKKKHKKK